MAKEIVVTSVPRGIKLGRTGFQVVMRTAGIGDGVMSSLEQLAAYRHVNPQGSGRNPVIYSYRSVRGTTGQLSVLGRTVDAGNDFSNRSNKLAHLLSVDSAELSTLRNSSPAAVLAAIEGRLATVWQGGPEERASPFALPSPPVQPAVCRHWEGATGDAGWGGVLAQRAVRGQPSLVIAPDCSPTWCRTLLELFQEVYALLPPDNRWRTTFDTTVIGSSSSLLRGTYAGSPESAAGHAGLLVVDLSSRAPVPANMATDDFVSVARHGPKQSVARGPSRMPNLPPTLEGTAGPTLPVGQTMVRQSTVGRHHPPVNPGDFEDEPKSRLHWYILCGVLLAAIVLVGGSVAAWYWLDHVITKDCQERIYAYADADAGKPDDPKSLPTIEDWRLAFRGEKEKPPADAEFPLLLSAMKTENVGKARVDSIEGRLKLLAAVQNVLQGKDVLTSAQLLGADVIIPGEDEARAALESIVAGWITSRTEKPAISDIGTLRKAIGFGTQVVDAAFDEQAGEARQALSEEAVDFLWQNVRPVNKRSGVMKRFRKSLVANKAGLSYEGASDALDKSITDVDKRLATPEAQATEHVHDETTKKTPAQLASEAFTLLQNQLVTYQPQTVEKLKTRPVILASDLDAEHLKFDISLPSCGDWTPTAEALATQNGGHHTWKLMGLPNAPKTHWGTVTLDTEKNELTFKSEIRHDGSQDHLYIPLRFSPKADQKHELKPITLNRIAAPQKVVATASEGVSCSLYDVLTGGPVVLTTSPALKVDPSLLDAPNVLTMTLNSPGSKDSPDFMLETRDSNGRQESSVDLWLNMATGDPTTKTSRRIWLESLSGKCEAADGILSIQLSRKNSLPWTERATRFRDRDPSKPFPKLSVDWNRDKFTDIVKLILDDHYPDPVTQKKNTIDNLKQRIVKCLDLDKKKEEMTDKRKLDAWRDLALDFVARKAFIEKRNVRPSLLEPPSIPDPKADPRTLAKYEDDQRNYLAVKKTVDDWDKDLEHEKTTDRWRIDFLFNDDIQDPDARDFAVALLGIDAWVGLDGRKPEIEKRFKDLTLDRIFEATLELRWQWTPDGEPTYVKRFEIKRPEPKPTRDMPL